MEADGDAVMEDVLQSQKVQEALLRPSTVDLFSRDQLARCNTDTSQASEASEKIPTPALKAPAPVAMEGVTGPCPEAAQTPAPVPASPSPVSVPATGVLPASTPPPVSLPATEVVPASTPPPASLPASEVTPAVPAGTPLPDSLPATQVASTLLPVSLPATQATPAVAASTPLPVSVPATQATTAVPASTPPPVSVPAAVGVKREATEPAEKPAAHSYAVPDPPVATTPAPTASPIVPRVMTEEDRAVAEDRALKLIITKKFIEFYY